MQTKRRLTQEELTELAEGVANVMGQQMAFLADVLTFEDHHKIAYIVSIDFAQTVLSAIHHMGGKEMADACQQEMCKLISEYEKHKEDALKRAAEICGCGNPANHGHHESPASAAMNN